MMDVSDGLAKDLHAVTPPGAAPALTAAAVPRRKGVDLRGALSDGEDFELLFVLRAATNRDAFQRAWQRKFPRIRLSCLGRFVAAGEVPPDAIPLDDFHGYEHLR